MEWELLRVFEKESFRSLEACGQQQWGIDPRTDDATGGRGGRRLCKSRRESFLSLSLSLLEPLTRRVLVQSIPHSYYYYYCCPLLTPPVSSSIILIQYTDSLSPSLQIWRHSASLPTPGPWAL
jgi:hypothetical protein